MSCRRSPAILALSWSLGTGCSRAEFLCESDEQCASASGAGTCELSGYCSFPDGSCESGRRYGSLADAVWAGQCVEDGGTTTTTATGPSPTTVGASDSVDPDVDTETTIAAASTGTDSSAATTTMASSTTMDASTTGPSDDPDLLLWLTFDDDVAATGVAVDASGHGRDFMCEPSMCPLQVDGPVGSAATFDGVDDILVLDADPALDLDMAYTIAAWIRVDSVPAPISLVLGRGVGTGGSNAYEIYTLQDVGTALLFNMDGAVEGLVSVPIRPDPNLWIHVAGTWDGATMQLYRDGTQVGEAPALGPQAYDGAPVTVGGDINDQVQDFFWPGGIDEVRLYARALDSDEIVGLASGG